MASSLMSFLERFIFLYESQNYAISGLLDNAVLPDFANDSLSV